MDNKYYVPEMTEFYYGFEYEILMPVGGYQKTTFGKESPPNPELNEFGNDDLMKIAHAIARVKIIDDEDMLELGFTRSDETDGFGGFKYVRKDELGFNTGTYLVATLLQNGKVYLEYETFGSYDTHSGNLHILAKNKSNFKKILSEIYF